MLKRDASTRRLSISQVGPKPTYRSSIDRIDVELVTSSNSKASTSLKDLSIPVGVAQ
jgi:hypothetical protein